ncbi:MAG: PadR family transcriptional regulator [Sphingobacteriales bacterium]|nr:MAG: PadR family transcriptional regulator [Sphingobacteriales bacterium]
MVNTDNMQAQMRKGIHEFCILSVIKRGEVYPAEIVAQMQDAQLTLLEGTLYPLLTRLKNAGLLTYRWVESSSGPPRKYFLLTPAGHQYYQELLTIWQDLSSAVNNLIHL